MPSSYYRVRLIVQTGEPDPDDPDASARAEVIVTLPASNGGEAVMGAYRLLAMKAANDKGERGVLAVSSVSPSLLRQPHAR